MTWVPFRVLEPGDPVDVVDGPDQGDYGLVVVEGTVDLRPEYFRVRLERAGCERLIKASSLARRPLPGQ